MSEDIVIGRWTFRVTVADGQVTVECLTDPQPTDDEWQAVRDVVVAGLRTIDPDMDAGFVEY